MLAAGPSFRIDMKPWFIAVSLISAMARIHSEPARPFQVIGHRGLGKANPNQPENGIAALLDALSGGAQAVELDVQLSRDGEVVLAHDEIVDRITDGSGCVAAKTTRELFALHLRDGAGRIHADQHLATLADALHAVRAVPGAVVDIHIKVYDGLHGDLARAHGCPATRFAALATRVAEIVRREDMVDSVFITSFDLRVLEAIHVCEPRLRRGLLCLFATPLALAQAKAAGLDAVVASNVSVDRFDARRAHALGMKLLVWFPLAESQRGDRFALRFADGIISDHPTLLAKGVR